MSIVAATAKYILKITPQFEADTLAEIQPAVTASPATYEGKYVRAKDQAAGSDIYYVEDAQVIPAYEQAGYLAESSAQDAYVKHFTATGEVTGIGVFFIDGVTDANGVVTVYATDDGSDTGTSLFSSIISVQASHAAIPANEEDAIYMGPADVSGAPQVDVQMIRGNEQTALLGVGVNSTRKAPENETVRVEVKGVLA